MPSSSPAPCCSVFHSPCWQWRWIFLVIDESWIVILKAINISIWIVQYISYSTLQGGNGKCCFWFFSWKWTDKMSALYSALCESIELSLAAGKVTTRSAPGVRGRPEKAGPAAFSGEQLWEARKLLICVSGLKSLVLMANFKFMLAVQNQLGLHCTAFRNSKFWWIKAHLKKRLAAEFRLCSCSSPDAAVPFLCRSRAFSLCSGACTGTPCEPASCEPACSQGPWQMWKKTMIPAPSFFEDCQSSGLQFKRESRLLESNNVLWPDKTNTKLPFSCEFDPDTTALWVLKKFSFYLGACGLRFEVALNSPSNYKFWFWKQRC